MYFFETHDEQILIHNTIFKNIYTFTPFQKQYRRKYKNKRMRSVAMPRSFKAARGRATGHESVICMVRASG